MTAVTLFLLPSVAALAEEGPLRGVWNGMLGKHSIVACFNGDGYTYSGSYYYVRHLAPIQLTKEKSAHDWIEQGSTGTWTLDMPADKRISGRWTSPDKKTQLPIHLELIVGSEKDKACASDLYNKKLEEFPKLIVGQKKEYVRKYFRTLRLGDVETLELLEQGPAIASINAQLRNDLPRSKEDLMGYFEVRREFLGRIGMAAEDQTIAEPSFWNALWVTVRSYRWTAGEGQGGIMWGYRTWNLRSGKEIDLWAWFGTKSFDHNGQYSKSWSQLPPKLMSFLFKDAGIDITKINSDCSDNYAPTAEYQIELGADSMKFSQRPRGYGCEIDFSAPYEKLLPYMTAEGKVFVKEIMESRKNNQKAP